MFTTRHLFHRLNGVSGIEMPSKFTFPFNYRPHELCKIAARELQEYLKNQTDFKHNFGLNHNPKEAIGKMFGVLVVVNQKNEWGYLAAFSGKMDNRTWHPGFVPPIFDTLSPSGFFKQGEKEISEINRKIQTAEQSQAYLALSYRLKNAHLQRDIELSEMKKKMKNDKKVRSDKRKNHLPTQDKISFELLDQSLKNESIRQHYLFKDLKKNWQIKIAALEQEWETAQQPIKKLKELRKTQSADLQQQLHESYRFLNADNQTKNLLDIFALKNLHPPAGAGECAAPKLLQYAYQQKWKPLAMAEFWWGISPPSEVREHQQFYPACRSKCEPILSHMMQGLNVEENPILKIQRDFELDIVYEDEWILVVNKAPQILSVPGKNIKTSIQSKVESYLPDRQPMVVHRLDMSTSGLLLIAKDLSTYKILQKQFSDRSVKKRYVAILEGIVKQKSGIIRLPLRVDLDNRPRQLVCHSHGKNALTRFEVVEEKEGKTRIHFFPHTGRTHQLRVHAAHHLGLHCPILGDDLYGTPQDRLYLHAEILEITHPFTSQRLKLKQSPDF